jgi:hypothetical protein
MIDKICPSLMNTPRSLMQPLVSRRALRACSLRQRFSTHLRSRPNTRSRPSWNI